MKLLYLHQHFATPKGSSGVRSYQMARRMIERGHSVTMVCGRGVDGQSGLAGEFRNGIRRGTVDGIDVVEIDLPYSNSDGFLKRTGIFLSFMLRTCRFVLVEKYDLLFATTTPLTVGVPGILGRWLRGKPFVFEVRDLWPELPRAMGVIRNPMVLWAMDVLEWASYRSAHRLIGLSPGIVEGIARRGVHRDRIALVPNGCDMDIFDLNSESWQPEGVDDGDFVAIFAGAHGIANGLDAVLDSAAILQKREVEGIKLVLIGSGMQKPHLQTRATHENLRNVIFLEAVPKTRLASLFKRANVGMQLLKNVPAFYYGTSPNKFFDYIAAGLPVLNNYPGWLAELIREHRCGVAVPPAHPEAFADALMNLASDKSEALRMGERAQELARSKFSRDKLAMKWVRLLEEVHEGQLIVK